MLIWDQIVEMIGIVSMADISFPAVLPNLTDSGQYQVIIAFFFLTPAVHWMVSVFLVNSERQSKSSLRLAICVDSQFYLVQKCVYENIA